MLFIQEKFIEMELYSITSCFPLNNKEGVIRYFEYGGVYTRKEKQMRFNSEDIEAVL